MSESNRHPDAALDQAFPMRVTYRTERADELRRAARRLRRDKATIQGFAAPGREVETVAMLLETMARDLGRVS